VQSSNPVLTRIASGRGQFGSGGVGINPGGSGPVVDLGERSVVTVDDVVTKTVLLVAVTSIFGAIGWTMVPSEGTVLALALFGSSMAGLVLGLVIAFARITNPVLITLYAAVQGVLLGVVSRYFEAAYPGIVVQAVVGTFGVFLGMGVLYKFRVLRATPRFTRWVLGALIGVVVLSLVNWVLAIFGVNLGLIEYSATGQVGWLPIVFALVCVGVGALTFILDFAAAEHAIRNGLPAKYSWYLAFGLLVGLIFLYWQILRLLSYLRR
jgi:uncharacterized YccA/Bax inhibitor family protein